jgi:hypothetical protein
MISVAGCQKPAPLLVRLLEMNRKRLYYEITLIRFIALQISYLIALNEQYWVTNARVI